MAGVIDLFTHVLPRAFIEYLERRTGGMPPSLSGILQVRTALYDLERRARVMDQFEGCCQVITLTVPPIESFGPSDVSRDLARVANDAMAEIVRADPAHYLGFVASVALDDVDGALDEMDRALRDLQAMGIQICTNVNGLPLDDARFTPFFERLAEHDVPLWVHPYRTPGLTDYASETSSRFGMWMAFGWPYETSVFMSRLILAGYLDRFPNLSIVTHHAGAMIPHFAHRIGAGLADLPPVAAEGEPPPTSHEELQARVIERYRRFYVDTAVAATRLGIQNALDFFGPEHVVFATDMPFDPENGPAWIRDTLACLDQMQLSAEHRQLILTGNARRLLAASPSGRGRRGSGG